jgi:DNA-binding SARP family transcriptional activator
MQAYAELGEVGSALRVFETYRSHLAEELGADPSPQTRELHLKLLRGSTL